ncbi:MAG: hypothetical protein MJ093_02940 [Saccharofermentans sp.]|nr:hypothetical protein [Saccharofermentans sp.]
MRKSYKLQSILLSIILSISFILSGCVSSDDMDAAEQVVIKYFTELINLDYRSAASCTIDGVNTFNFDDLSPEQITVLEWLLAETDVTLTDSNAVSSTEISYTVELGMSKTSTLDSECPLEIYMESLKKADNENYEIEIHVIKNNNKWRITNPEETSDLYHEIVSNLSLKAPLPPLPSYMDNPSEFIPYVENLGYPNFENLPISSDFGGDNFKYYFSPSEERIFVMVIINNINGSDDFIGITFYDSAPEEYEISDILSQFDELNKDSKACVINYDNDTTMIIMLSEKEYKIRIIGNTCSIKMEILRIDTSTLEQYSISSMSVSYANDTIEEFGFVNPNDYVDEMVPISDLL